MSDSGWSQGYVTDAIYADRFFRELSPAWLNYVAALCGASPRNVDQAFTYLDLGCGLGSSTIVNAGAFPPGEFHACDFNPAHIEGGQRHAAALGISNIQFHEASFQDLLLQDLPAFDFIVLHGVYSWVGAESRQAIRRIIREMLKPGGLVYLSYNCLPGWSIEVPLRRLLLELAATGGGGSPQRTQQALRSLKQLSSSKLRYFTANPSAVTAVDSYTKDPTNYLAHEFLNQTWEPFYSVDIGDEMADAEVRYLGSATLVDNHPALVVDELATEAVATLATGRQRQLATDFAANQRFRRDVFVRGHEGLGETTRHLRAAAIGSLGNPERIGTKARVPRGEIHFQEDFIRGVQSLMVRGSTTIGQAVTALGGEGRDAVEIARNVIFLVAAGTLMPFAKARRQSPGVKARGLANRTVERVLAHVIEHRAPRAIPSETLGNGLEILPVEALAITEVLAGADGVEALAARLEAGITRLNLTITSDGRELPRGDELVAYTRVTAQGVIEDLLPTLMRLGVII
jgi:ubiquinone/menaquinone biosynthesis C-methylase UbiE